MTTWITASKSLRFWALRKVFCYCRSHTARSIGRFQIAVVIRPCRSMSEGGNPSELPARRRFHIGYFYKLFGAIIAEELISRKIEGKHSLSHRLIAGGGGKLLAANALDGRHADGSPNQFDFFRRQAPVAAQLLRLGVWWHSTQRPNGVLGFRGQRRKRFLRIARLQVVARSRGCRHGLLQRYARLMPHVRGVRVKNAGRHGGTRRGRR